MTTTTLRTLEIGAGAGASRSRPVHAALRIVRLWHARTRQRLRLADLSHAELRDIGVSRRAAAAEAAKPFWRA